MKRREFITFLGGAAAMSPFAARAEELVRLRTIGVLGTNASVWKRWTDAFEDRLNELGWKKRRSIAIEYRWDEGRAERDADIADEFVRRKVDVISRTEAQSPL